MTRLRLAVFVWSTLFLWRSDGSLFWAAVAGSVLVVAVDRAIETGKSIQRQWRERG